MSSKGKRTNGSNRGHPPDLELDLDDHVTIDGDTLRALQRLPGSSRNVYVALLRRKADKRYVPIIVSALAVECGLHRSTTRRALTRLRDANLAKQRVDHGQERWKALAVKEV